MNIAKAIVFAVCVGAYVYTKMRGGEPSDFLVFGAVFSFYAVING